MTFLIIVLLIGIILRWDNIRKKALIWFRYDDIMEERAVQDSLKALRQELPADPIEAATIVSDTLR